LAGSSRSAALSCWYSGLKCLLLVEEFHDDFSCPVFSMVMRKVQLVKLAPIRASRK
jgi:hypothetical protein